MANPQAKNNSAYYDNNKKTYDTFLRMTVISIVCIIIVLAGMAIFLV